MDLSQHDPFSQSFSKIRQLTLTDCSLSNASDNFFSQNFPNLDVLNIAVEPDLYGEKEYDELKHPPLDTSLQTRLKSFSLVDSAHFEDFDFVRSMTNLVVLKLDVGRIEDIDDDAFDNLAPNLQVLHITSNRISFRVGEWLSSLVGLRDLRLSGCRKGFNHIMSLRNLEKLVVTGYDTKELVAGAFRNLTRLKSLTLRTFVVNRIDEAAFSGLENLSELTLEEISDPRLRLRFDLSLLKDMRNLRKLCLIESNFTMSKDDCFDAFPNLIHLELNEFQHNFEISERTFLNLGNLKRLELNNNNKIKRLRKNVFAGLGKLIRLSLYGSEFCTVSENAFNGLSSLRELDLRLDHRSDFFKDLSSILSKTPKLRLLLLDEEVLESNLNLCANSDVFVTDN
jgi:hypothetical protein